MQEHYYYMFYIEIWRKFQFSVARSFEMTEQSSIKLVRTSHFGLDVIWSFNRICQLAPTVPGGATDVGTNANFSRFFNKKIAWTRTTGRRQNARIAYSLVDDDVARIQKQTTDTEIRNKTRCITAPDQQISRTYGYYSASHWLCGDVLPELSSFW